VGEKKPKPHYHGHRDRLRERFAKGGADALADYELLELYLFNSVRQGDVKPTAKALIAKFGSFAEAVAAPVERLVEVKGVGPKTALDLQIIKAAATKLGQESILGLTLLTGRNPAQYFSLLFSQCGLALTPSLFESMGAAKSNL